MLLAQNSAPVTDSPVDTATDIFGTVSPPPGVEIYDQATNVPGGIGLIVFMSTLIRIATVAAGVWVMLNLILAGYDYITSNGDTGAHKRVTDRVTMSVIGLVIIVAAYTVTALISLVLFGDPRFILAPEISGPTIPETTNN
jgi:hypothetical protein